MGKFVAAHILRKGPGRLVSLSQKGFNTCRYYFNGFFIVLVVGHDKVGILPGRFCVLRKIGRYVPAVPGDNRFQVGAVLSVPQHASQDALVCVYVEIDLEV